MTASGSKNRQKITAPAFALRGVMLDMGRIVERKEYYTLLLPWLAEWGYNLLHLHLIDDERCALKFPSHPELASKGAFTADEMVEFVQLARSLGIAVMPEIEALGHARLIFEHRRHRALKEPNAPDARTSFNALCPAHPGTRKLISELLVDVASIFDYPVIHLGLDEVQLGSCPRCKRRFGARTPDWKRYAEHARWAQDEVRRLGRRPAMWADHIVTRRRSGYSADIVKGMKRDVLMFNWDYHPEYSAGNARQLLEAGFDVVACPASSRYGTVMLPYGENLHNLRTTTARSLAPGQGVIKGIVNTVWCPWRYLPGAIDFVMAFAAHLMNTAEEDPAMPLSFARRFYGLRSGRKVGAALVEAHGSAFSLGLMQRMFLGGDGAGNAFSREDRRVCAETVRSMDRVLAALKSERKKVRRNLDRYDDLVISAEALRLLALYGERDRVRGVPGARALYRRAERAWNRDRQPGDRMRFCPGNKSEMQSMLYLLKMTF